MPASRRGHFVTYAELRVLLPMVGTECAGCAVAKEFKPLQFVTISP
jgi:hypothetical protein